MKQTAEQKAIHEIYRQLYVASDPPADFDLLMENSPKNEQGQIMIPYMNHEISEELCDQIIDEVLGNLRISKRMKQTLRTAIYLGCSPKFKAQQTQ